MQNYNLLHLDTGRCYRYVANIKISNPSRYNLKYIKEKISKLKIKDLQNKILLTDKVATVASIIAKDKKIRKLVHSYQLNCAYNPPLKYDGSCLDGRDITYKIIPDAELKFFITANIKTRALRRYKELKRSNKNISYKDVLKVLKNAIKMTFLVKFRP